MISLTGSLLPAPFSSEALNTPDALLLQRKAALTKKRRARSIDSDLEEEGGDSDAGSVNFNEEAEDESRERSEAPPAVVAKVKKTPKKPKGAEPKAKKAKTPKVDSPAGKKGTPSKAKKSKKE